MEEKNADLMTAFQESVEPQEFSTEMDEDNNSDAAYAGKTVDILGSSMQMTGCWILMIAKALHLCVELRVW